MSKLAASLAVLVVTAGLALAGGGVAFADSNDNHSVSDDHSDNSRHHAAGNCSARHSVNVANCGIDLLDLGSIL